MSKVKLIFVGGFLGAGKTTLLQSVSGLLAAGGRSVGLITNDQAEGLVDTRLLTKTNGVVKEISGSCFCCNYNGFTEAVEALMRHREKIDVIIAEPVGSCTDISATILQPLKEQMRAVLELAPFTVLADPEKLERILEGDDAGMHPSAAYIYRKQLEESDLIGLTKADRISPERLQVLTGKTELVFPGRDVRCISARSGAGVTGWLNDVMTGTVSGSRITAVDYAVYAEGEAVLGWLNAVVLLQGTTVDWDVFLEAYFYRLNDLLGVQAPVGHIKVMIECMGNQYRVGNQTGTLDTLQFRGTAGVSNIAAMTINARVEADPRLLEQQVFEALAETVSEGMFYEVRRCRSLSPGYPRPRYKYDYVVV
ncbi:GTP-binding protein [Niabella drilacis]|uniref:CobW/HypB/UreG, nucleotide-binding domain n=1 Tax=Niabella drilacis (strain DSM 25811 / CCM 8410 / CCUG 62505 / LMG 26954 / E90) TaxID=1285928 RepID=A0A1G6JMK3_NIADE|nr:GTP-binding protein [Niabella drilacis]SDC19891.1 CobW/HypB/UreG, nucleotide-binding domain [Niabella drilacis]